MQLEDIKLLTDIQMAAGEIHSFIAGLDLAAYRNDAKTRAAVERKFEIIGEACARLRDNNPDLFSELENGRQIIAFRNRLIHGYDNVDDTIVWDIITSKLPALMMESASLIDRS